MNRTVAGSDDYPYVACPFCGAPISDRYLPYGVCQNCYGTTDAPDTLGDAPEWTL